MHVCAYVCMCMRMHVCAYVCTCMQVGMCSNSNSLYLGISLSLMGMDVFTFLLVSI